VSASVKEAMMTITRTTRRQILLGGAGLLSVVLVRPALAAPDSMQAAIRAFVGEAKPQPGRIHLEIPQLVENGNAAPVTVAADSPMSEADHVKAIGLFNEKNPLPNVAVFHLGPRSGRARIETRMRLATSQTITAIAMMSDGSVWSDTAQVIVTLAACIEG
jgi:sulfur-oxidizing protein SoxY